MPDNKSEDIALVLSGGVGLGAYHGGVYEGLHRQGRYRPVWLAGSSVGAVNAALIAGNKREQRLERLRQFWVAGAVPIPLAMPSGPLRHLQNWSGVLHARLFGARGHFRPHLPTFGSS